jgi:hypothetical protein
MRIPVLSGIYTDGASDFRTSYPRNLVPVPISQGISEGYLRPADGIESLASGPGIGRGGINWNDECYRVMGTKLVKVSSSNVVTTLGDVGGHGQVIMDYSFDKLAVESSGNLYYWDGATLQQVTDPDLGVVVDFVWVDGYFLTTDGEFLITTELTDPFSVLPTKYGSSEADPDPVKALLKLRNEPYALNRYTIEVFDNVGGSGFPFARIDGAQIQRGVIGTHACCVFLESIAFVGGGRNEAVAVWLGASGSSVKISSREIDLILEDYTDAELSTVLVESRVAKGQRHLYVHLPDKTLVYDGVASQLLGQAIWFTLDSGSTIAQSMYRARNLIYCYNEWLVEDPLSTNVGKLVSTSANHWGVAVAWEFGTVIIYNEGRGAIIHELELIALTGRQPLGVNSTIWTAYSLDGVEWSAPKSIRTGTSGNRSKRLNWLQQGALRNWRIQRFSGLSDAMISVAQLQARLEALVA